MSNFGEFRQEAPSSPSTRDPSISTHESTADDIDRELEKHGHRIWGFVIYRSTYSSDIDWAECLSKIRAEFEEHLDICNGLDVMESNPFTVFDDRGLFEGAGTAAIRTHFNQWAVAALPTEQNTTGPGIRGPSTRYLFCLQVDEESMRSIVDDTAETFGQSQGYVKLIDGTWQPESEAELQEEAAMEGRGVQRFDGIEGCTQYNVGWMRASYLDLISFYLLFAQMQNVWRTTHRRPPIVVKY